MLDAGSVGDPAAVGAVLQHHQAGATLEQRTGERGTRAGARQQLRFVVGQQQQIAVAQYRCHVLGRNVRDARAGIERDQRAGRPRPSHRHHDIGRMEHIAQRVAVGEQRPGLAAGLQPCGIEPPAADAVLDAEIDMLARHVRQHHAQHGLAQRIDPGMLHIDPGCREHREHLRAVAIGPDRADAGRRERHAPRCDQHIAGPARLDEDALGPAVAIRLDRQPLDRYNQIGDQIAEDDEVIRHRITPPHCAAGACAGVAGPSRSRR